MTNEQRPLCLALQGGGSHGAYTWGVLDALLADGRFSVNAVSGTSAGALNAAALVQGLAQGGPEGARQKLELLWKEVGRRSPLRATDWFVPGSAQPFFGPVLRASLEAFQLFNTLVSPYQTGLPTPNVLEGIIDKVIDIGSLQGSTIPLFVSATDVRTGNLKIFSGDEIGTKALLASACLPDLFPAVEIGENAYWDGGYAGNPSLKPLLELDDECLDILIVQVTPFVREGLPRSVSDIMNRVNEITFNASFLRELTGICEGQGYLRRQATTDTPELQRLQRLRLHFLPASAELGRDEMASKVDTRPTYLDSLRRTGRQACLKWLASGGAGDVGKRSSLDLGALLSPARTGGPALRNQASA